MKTLKICISMTLLFLLFNISCKNKSPNAPGQSDDEFSALINSVPDLPEPSAKDDTTTSLPTTEVINNENWTCTTTTHNVTKAPDEFSLFDPNSEIVYPGNLLQGATIQNTTPEPIPVRRGPGTIVMTMVHGGQSASREIPEVSLANVFDAQNQIISEVEDKKVIPQDFLLRWKKSIQGNSLRLP